MVLRISGMIQILSEEEEPRDSGCQIEGLSLCSRKWGHRSSCTITRLCWIQAEMSSKFTKKIIGSCVASLAGTSDEISKNA